MAVRRIRLVVDRRTSAAPHSSRWPARSQWRVESDPETETFTRWIWTRPVTYSTHCDSADDCMPTWTPDGRAIAFVRDGAGGSESIPGIAAATAGGGPVILHDLGRNGVTGSAHLDVRT